MSKLTVKLAAVFHGDSRKHKSMPNIENQKFMDAIDYDPGNNNESKKGQGQTYLSGFNIENPDNHETIVDTNDLPALIRSMSCHPQLKNADEFILKSNIGIINIGKHKAVEAAEHIESYQMNPSESMVKAMFDPEFEKFAESRLLNLEQIPHKSRQRGISAVLVAKEPLKTNKGNLSQNEAVVVTCFSEKRHDITAHQFFAMKKGFPEWKQNFPSELSAEKQGQLQGIINTACKLGFRVPEININEGSLNPTPYSLPLIDLDKLSIAELYDYDSQKFISIDHMEAHKVEAKKQAQVFFDKNFNTKAPVLNETMDLNDKASLSI